MDSDRENQHEFAESDDGSDSGDEVPQTNSIKSVLKQAAPEVKKPELPEQPEPETLDFSKMTPLSPEIISRQATYGTPKIVRSQLMKTVSISERLGMSLTESPPLSKVSVVSRLLDSRMSWNGMFSHLFNQKLSNGQ
jgi:hypothetical protein